MKFKCLGITVSKLHSRRNEKHIKSAECFPLFGSENGYNFTGYFIWASHFVSHSKGRTQIESQKTALKRMFGNNKEEEAGGWRKLHYEQLHNLFSLSNIVAVTES
jgi:hypothetical protein